MTVQRLLRGLRRTRTPQGLDQIVDRHHLADSKEQEREHRTLLRPHRREIYAVGVHLEPAEEPKDHSGSSVTPAARYHHVTPALPGRETLTRSIARSGVPVPELSQTEERIALLAAQGRSRQEIAAAVGLDVRTVDWHLAQASRKLEKAASVLARARGKRRKS